ncbi:UbiA-like protein EboC [Flaviaesturariibacter amylovorans]|uniref:UbiA family prenyltransferase n=1 Tax=Flaviaesturariibacter amylovorans TaxID=1084520 RepID=A0ABP8HSF9_9BACT
MNTTIAMLRLMRPANIITAVSDILAGAAIALFAGNADWRAVPVVSVLLLVAATAGLYGGGVVLNDVFDAELDRVERPERPIPSGAIGRGAAALLGAALLVAGIVAAGFVHRPHWLSASFLLAGAIAVAAVIYDKWGKHHSLAGPLNMGLCRGLNLLLGMSLLPEALRNYWLLALVPIVYIASITMVSRGEVHGGSRRTLHSAVALYAIVAASIFLISVRNGTWAYALPFLLLFAGMIFAPLRKAIRDPRGPLIGKAVKAGVIALILMNAAWAAAFGNLPAALLILALLPLSLGLAKAFMVT